MLGGARSLRFLTLGTVSPHKRLGTVIDIVAILRGRGFDATLDIWGPVGDEREAARLRQAAQARLGYDPLRGPLATNQRTEVFRSADFLVMGSSTESFGFAMVEAMRSSTVVVAPRSPLVHEICDNSAITYDQCSTASAADAIVAALPRLPELADAGLSRSQEVFTWSRCVDDTLEAILGQSV
ncbi:MAG TPA: glycosyltransferase [Chloroflexota bacterium]|nr:glycosyltransferase [Chloroflexota bacterium]